MSLPPTNDDSVSPDPAGGDDRPVDVDLGRSATVPRWVREAMETRLAIEEQDARQAGALGFMYRALVNTSMPYKDPKSRIFERKNGSLHLTIIAGYEGGIPYGVHPRLLMSWVSTEVVRTKSPELELGDSLTTFLHNVAELNHGGGKRGSSTRFVEQMKRLFGSTITAVDAGKPGNRGFRIRNLSVVQEADVSEHDLTRIGIAAGDEKSPDDEYPIDTANRLWTPQENNAGGWKSRVLLSEYFFKEILQSPVPIDLRAYRALRGSPLAMDVYTWLTYRNSYLQHQSRRIHWEDLMLQFGSDFKGDRAVIEFRKAFKQALRAVQTVYDVKVDADRAGVVLIPSGPHVPKIVVPGLPGLPKPQSELDF